ncbi:MAG: methyltransferase domain-containing protein [Pyrinomonadaceae bacterium]|nr:methyltransferase domain-containing protein [Pyrinomonadaceae bacterium]
MSSRAPSQKLFGSDRSVIEAEIKNMEEVECPVCGIAPKPFAVDYQGFQLCRCPQCDLQFLSPRPTFEQLSEKVYNETYHAETDTSEHLSEASRYQFERQYKMLEKLLGRTGQILDVGCGNGTFLRYGQERGWEAYGCDISLSPYVRESKSFPLREGRLLEIDFGQTRFDAIRFNHVLEHTQNPLAELVRSRELLKPGGVIFISVPNIGGISTHLKNLQSRLHLKSRRWRHYAALHHLWFFTPKTLRQLIEHSGLRVLHWETPVFKKEGQSVLLETVQRGLFEKSHTSSILDFYCTFAN